MNCISNSLCFIKLVSLHQINCVENICYQETAYVWSVPSPSLNRTTAQMSSFSFRTVSSKVVGYTIALFCFRIMHCRSSCMSRLEIESCSHNYGSRATVYYPERNCFAFKSLRSEFHQSWLSLYLTFKCYRHQHPRPLFISINIFSQTLLSITHFGSAEASECQSTDSSGVSMTKGCCMNLRCSFWCPSMIIRHSNII